MSSVQADISQASVTATWFNASSSNSDRRFTLPQQWSVRAGFFSAGGSFETAQCGGQPAQWTATTPKDGKATIDLGDGYKLELDESSSQMKIINENTGEVTNIWGDPHIDWNGDGKTDADFWGTTTFTLGNGTKITIGTEPYKGDPNMYVANTVTITHGSNAIVVDGLSQNTLGDMTITQSQNGYAVDAATADGLVVAENDAGAGWIDTRDGKMVTQEDFNAFKPGANPQLNSDFTRELGLFLMLGFLAGFALGAAGAGSTQDKADRPSQSSNTTLTFSSFSFSASWSSV